MRTLSSVPLACLASGLALSAALAQQNAATEGSMRSQIPNLEGAAPSNIPEQLEDPKAANVAVTGHILEPKQVEPTPERIEALSLPEGFSISIFADGLENPRFIAVAEDGTLYVTQNATGDLMMLKDEDGDGTSDARQSVANRKGISSVAIDGSTVYIAAVNSVFSAERQADGTLGELKEIIDDLPDGGQHSKSRMILVGPDGKLYISVGSTCNACMESSSESATMLQAEPDGSSRKIFASGLRNTIGYGFEPESGALYGFDHGIDWLGDDEQPEEFNLIEAGKQYGWPYVYADSQFNPQDEPPSGTMEEWAAASTEPVLMYTPHAAPMQMAFYSGGAFPEEYRGDAFAAMRGSWNRKPPSGYEVVRVRFEGGKPQAIEPFITGFLSGEGEDWSQMGRLAGLAVAPDGSMYLSDDTNGVIYRISHSGEQGAEPQSSTAVPSAPPAAAETPTPTPAPAN